MDALLKLEISRRPRAAKRLGYLQETPKKQANTALYKLEAKRRPRIYKKLGFRNPL